MSRREPAIDDAEATRKALHDLDIEELRVDVVGVELYVRGVAHSYATKCLAGLRAHAAFPAASVSNRLRIGQRWHARVMPTSKDVR